MGIIWNFLSFSPLRQICVVRLKSQQSFRASISTDELQGQGASGAGERQMEQTSGGFPGSCKLMLTFGQDGGTIERAAGNEWILHGSGCRPHQKHARLLRRTAPRHLDTTESGPVSQESGAALRRRQFERRISFVSQ